MCPDSSGRIELADAPLSASSRMKVDRESRHAFQYKWNCRSVAARELVLRQTIVSVPVIVRARGSSVARIV
jgi:hypothetical protein